MITEKDIRSATTLELEHDVLFLEEQIRKLERQRIIGIKSIHVNIISIDSLLFKYKTYQKLIRRELGWRNAEM